MERQNWRAVYLVVVLLLLAVLTARWFWPVEEVPGERLDSYALVQDDLRAYLPALVGTTFFFEGEGNEFATFSRALTFREPGLLQLEDLSGTNLAMVVELKPDELKVVYLEEEFYTGENLLSEAVRRERELGRPANLVLLKAPLRVGTSWSDNDYQREIVAVNQVVEVPLGVFYDVVMVKAVPVDSPSTVLYEYYAKNAGLIKRVFVSTLDEEPYSVVSSLKGLGSAPAH